MQEATVALMEKEADSDPFAKKMIKKMIMLTVMALAFGVSELEAQTWVNGYTKSNGTTVQGHYRSNSDGVFSNNWSTKGNTNPYTGKKGTRTLLRSKKIFI